MRRIKMWKFVGVWILVAGLICYPFIPVIWAQEESASDSATLTTETGDASSIGSATTIVNTITDEDSEIEAVGVVVDEQSQDIAPFEMDIASSSATSDEIKNTASIVIEDEVIATTAALVEAITGNNSQQSTQAAAIMETGDGVALASALTIANTTLINSTIGVGSVSVLAPWSGNLILDPLWQEQTPIINPESVTLLLSNTGDVVTVAEASVETGNNLQVASGSAELITGSGMALSSSASIVNTTLVDTDAIAILAENLWLWSGNVLNLEYPGSRSSASELLGAYTTKDTEECGNGCGITLMGNNEANVSTVAQANVITGENIQETGGDGKIQTGTAVAGAVSTSIVNTTLINSRLRLLHLLLFSSWSGDLIFAYPDLSIAVESVDQVSEGTSIPYQIRVSNLGYKKAQGVKVRVHLRSENNEIKTEEKYYQELGSREELGWDFELATSGMGGEAIVIEVSVATEAVEESLSNNAASARTTIIKNETSLGSNDTDEDTLSQEEPKLALAANNNIGEYVYPGDKFVYDAEITNVGSITTRDVELIQSLHDPAGTKISEVRGKVGEIKINERKRVKMTLFLAENSLPGTYTTNTYATGKGEQSEASTQSNIVTNTIPLRLRGVAQIGKVEATQDVLTESVLGAINEPIPFPWECSACRALPWYLGFMGGTMVYFFFNRRAVWSQSIVNRGLAMPLTGYAGLLYSSPNCHSGLMMNSGNLWCDWYLPISIVSYLAICLLINWARKIPVSYEIGITN